MAFSSSFFLFAFLPIFLAFYFLTPAILRNVVLLLFSLAFYWFDTGPAAWILVASIVLNHFAAKAIFRWPSSRVVIFITATALNLAPLLYYKYAAFFWGVFFAAPSSIALPNAAELPNGISFFTFQAISYIADVCMRVTSPAKNVISFGAYHSLFPQLIAGPIVRYVEIEQELYSRRPSIAAISDGLFRFCLGLGKKLIIADQVGIVVDRIFALPASELSTSVAWVGIACYTLQIYYDFSGYSDMAIGLGRMLGFKFPENFNQPYRSRSITEFWRRWHMTLSRWFRDYVYIPLGGNRHGSTRTYFNLVLVFFLCGLWHGAGWTFIAWGLFHGALLTVERVYSHKIGPLPGGMAMWALTLVLVMVGWTLFRATSLDQALHYLGTMFGLSSPSIEYFTIWSYLTPKTLTFMAVGTFFALVPFERETMNLGMTWPAAALRAAGGVAILAYSVILLSAHSFNPFIYFRF
jgi:alginate O-acetyltransferase complex protein AlgI